MPQHTLLMHLVSTKGGELTVEVSPVLGLAPHLNPPGEHVLPIGRYGKHTPAPGAAEGDAGGEAVGEDEGEKGDPPPLRLPLP